MTQSEEKTTSPSHKERAERGIEDVVVKIGLATYGGISFNPNPEYIEKVGSIIHHELQKARHEWLRDEIVKLEGIKNEDHNHTDCESYADCAMFSTHTHSFNRALQTIIDRYQSELDQPLTIVGESDQALQAIE